MTIILAAIGFAIVVLLFWIWMELVQIRRLYRQDQDRREEGDEWKDA
jgi:flagellar biosynthesis/type III secretory pathway M-ring protein FliF/YscJ